MDVRHRSAAILGCESEVARKMRSLADLPLYAAGECDDRRGRGAGGVGSAAGRPLEGSDGNCGESDDAGDGDDDVVSLGNGAEFSDGGPGPDISDTRCTSFGVC